MKIVESHGLLNQLKMRREKQGQELGRLSMLRLGCPRVQSTVLSPDCLCPRVLLPTLQQSCHPDGDGAHQSW